MLLFRVFIMLNIEHLTSNVSEQSPRDRELKWVAGWCPAVMNQL